jgi:signal transduction histidine kinase
LAREAEGANQARSQRLAQPSHDVRTPTKGILGMPESLLLEGDLTKSQHEFAHTAHRSARGRLTISDDVLTLSKIEAGRMNLESVDFDVRLLVEDVNEPFAETAHRKLLEVLGLVGDGVLRRLRGDPNRMRQTLVDLVGKATKFTQSVEVVPGRDHST